MEYERFEDNPFEPEPEDILEREADSIDWILNYPINVEADPSYIIDQFVLAYGEQFGKHPAAAELELFVKNLLRNREMQKVEEMSAVAKDDLTEKLVKLANLFDDRGLIEVADVIDKLL